MFNNKRVISIIKIHFKRNAIWKLPKILIKTAVSKLQNNKLIRKGKLTKNQKIRNHLVNIIKGWSSKIITISRRFGDNLRHWDWEV